MTLIEKLEKAIAAKDKSQLAALEAQAQAETVPLLAAGQKNYALKVQGLIEQLKAIRVETFARSPEDFAPRPKIAVNVGLREEGEA